MLIPFEISSALGHSKAVKLFLFMCGDHIFRPTLFRRAGGGKKGEAKFPAMYLRWLITPKSSKMKDFSSCLARIVGTAYQLFHMRNPMNR